MPKTITDIIPPSRRRAMETLGPVDPTSEAPRTEADIVAPPPPRPPMSTPCEKTRKKFPLGYVIAAIVVVLVCIGVLFALGGAKVEVSPIKREVTVSGSFTATPSSGDLPYEVVSVDLVVEREIPAEGEETVDLPAQGIITIYNGQTKPQELIKNTRFESPDGLIFRIRESVVVPAGTSAKPGELQVTVYADAGGTSYNIGPSTFSLPGLASSPAFDLVYAKSVEPMSGGFSGTRPSVEATKRAAIYEEMQQKLDADLRKKVAESVGEAHVLIPGAVFTRFTPEPDGDGASDEVKLVVKGTANAFIFPKEALGKAVAYATLAVYTGQGVIIESGDGLTFTPDGGAAPVPGAELLSFTLSGTTNIVWLVNIEDLRMAIAGKSRDATKTILAGFSELADAKLILRPFWAGSMPTNPEDIEVIVKEPVATLR